MAWVKQERCETFFPLWSFKKSGGVQRCKTTGNIQKVQKQRYTRSNTDE